MWAKIGDAARLNEHIVDEITFIVNRNPDTMKGCARTGAAPSLYWGQLLRRQSALELVDPVAGEDEIDRGLFLIVNELEENEATVPGDVEGGQAVVVDHPVGLEQGLWASDPQALSAFDRRRQVCRLLPGRMGRGHFDPRGGIGETD